MTDLQKMIVARPLAPFLPLITALCGAVLLACGALQFSTIASSHRPAMLVVVLALLGAAFVVQLALPLWGKRLPANALPFDPKDPAWGAALALTCVVAMVGLTLVGLLAIYPPALEKSVFKLWDYHDRRWLVGLYLLAVGLPYLPGLIHRALAPPRAVAPLEAAPTVRTSALRILVAVLVGAGLAVLYLAPMLPASLVRFVDVHELVHLGGLQAIAQGASPYLEARTQYGPGHQLVSYDLMRATGFSLRGFRLGQAWLNLAAIAVMLALWIYAFGARMGGAVIVVSLALSPLLVATFWGWGLLLRWVAPVMVGAILPLLIWRDVRPITRMGVVALLAVLCGGLGWFAQESFSGVVVTAGLLLGAGVVRGALTFRQAVGLGVLFVAVQAATLVSFLAWSVGPSHLRETLRLYSLSTGLVFSGMTAVPWGERGVLWQLGYRFTPTLIVLITTAALYWRRPTGDPADERRVGQLLGMAAAAAPLTMLTLLRADGAHFIASSTALAPLAVCTVAYLPGRFAWGWNWRNGLRVALAAVFVLIYLPNPIGNLKARTGNLRTFANPRRLGDPGATAEGFKLLFDPSAGSVATDPDPVVRRLGFRPDPSSRCCYNRDDWTFAQWSGAIRQIHTEVAGRPAFVDLTWPLETSSIYFLSDLPVGSSYVSRMMSIWTDDDLRAVEQEFARRKPQCVVSDRPESELTRTLLKTYGAYSQVKVAGPTGILVFCAAPAPAPAPAPAAAGPEPAPPPSPAVAR